MNKINRKSAVVVITSVVLLGTLALSTGITSAEKMPAEELFELLSGGWDFNGTMTLSELTMPIIGTRAVILTGPTAADFVAIMEGAEEAEIGKAWWDAEKEKLAIKEGEEEPKYFDLLENGYGGTYELEEGIPEWGITEKLFCVENLTIVDGNTLAHIWVARNKTGILVAKWEATFTRTDKWHVCEGISIQDAIENADDGDTVIVHEGIYEEQLYIAKSLDLRAAEGESPEILAPEPEELESYICNFSLVPWSFIYTPIIMMDGGSDGIVVNISGFVINGSPVAAGNSEYSISGVVYYNASGIFENNEVKNIWGGVNETARPLPWNGDAVSVISNSSVTIRKNYIHNYTGDEAAGIFVYCGANATVTQNNVSSPRTSDASDQCGIEVGRCSTATVCDNIVMGHLYKDHWWHVCGISFWDSNGTIRNNTLIDNMVGICVKTGWAQASSSVTVGDNVVSVSEVGNAPGAGIMVTTHKPFFGREWIPSLTATITGNKLIGINGSGTGIVIGAIPEHKPFGMVTAKITRNIISGWDCGIKLFNTSNSTIYLNDFVNNTQSVFVNESTNIYCSPEKLGYTYEAMDYKNYVGNYWSDYVGEDTNADGIGDIPYEITGDNPDIYPLMHSQENYEQIGILVVAHGSPRESWCKPVREAVENVSMGYPTELGFLEFVGELEGYNFVHEAVDKLNEQGVTKIVAVPLFMSSNSGHIAEIEYVLGLRETLPEMVAGAVEEKEPGERVVSRTRAFVEGVEMERFVISREGRYFISYTPISNGESVSAMQHRVEEEELVPVDTTAEIVLTGAIDDHSFIAQILADRAAGLCTDPTNETVVIVGHGTDEEDFFPGWVNSSESLAEKVKLILRHCKGIDIEDTRYSFVFSPDDYPENLTVRAVVENVSATSHPVVVPLMVSEGFFTGRYIPNMLLAGLDYGYPERGRRALTPHESVANWIEVTAAKELTEEFGYPTVQIYDGEELLGISLDEVGAHHGKICPCVAFAFRSALRAFSEEELWDGIPHRGNVKIISAHPSDGHRMTFEYILNSTGDVVIQSSTDIINITADNYVYTFINKTTNDSVTLRVKEDIFPEHFFELRTENKLGTATKEDKKAFKLFWGMLREKAMYKPAGKVFEEA